MALLASTAERFEVADGNAVCAMPGFRRGRDVTTGQTAAIRLVLTPDAASVARFEYESAIRAVLKHPFVLRYLAHGPWGEGARYLAAEWLEGETLAARVARGPLGVEESLQLCHRIAEALCAAHGAGIAHRGLRAESIFLSGGSVTAPRLVDFGEAASGAPPGFDPGADVYALGRVWFLALTGQNPGAVTSARALRPEVPPGADELLERMLSTFEPERPPDARAVLAAIAQVRHTGRWNVAVSSRPPRPALPPPGPDPVLESGRVARTRHSATPAPHGEAATGMPGAATARHAVDPLARARDGDGAGDSLDAATAEDQRLPTDAASDALPVLQRLFNECVAAGRARVAVVTSDRAMQAARAAASLAYALPARRAPEIWLLRADAASERDRLGALSALMRQLAGVGPTDAPADRYRKLKDRVRRRVAREAHLRLTGYLGHLARVPVPPEELGRACALLNDPARLEPAVERAWVEFVAAESAVQPVLLVLDGMHLFDATTVAFVETAVRELRDRPLMVLGLAHPRVRARFPEAFAGCDLHEVVGRPSTQAPPLEAQSYPSGPPAAMRAAGRDER